MMVCKITPKMSPTQREVNRDPIDPTQEVADYEAALDSAGYGRFSLSTLGACICAFFYSGVENCVMSYVLPAARCELRLTTYQAGLINMGFMSGGVASAFFWGIVGDVFGRKNTLTLTLLLDATITLAQSTVSDYRMLLAARTVNGFIIGGPGTLVFSYLSDLIGVKKRELYLSIVGMSFVVAWLILPAVAWLVLPFKNTGHETLLPMYSWRLYLALCSLPGFIGAVWMMYLPESPRLLLDTNRGDKALKLLAQIHKTNKGKNSEYKVKKLIPDDMLAAKSVNGDENRTKDLFMSVLRDLKLFVSKSYALKSTLILFVFFANMAAGFGLNMWIPELLLRMQGRECNSTVHNNTEKAAHNASNLVWKELAKIYAYEKPERLVELNTTGLGIHERRGEQCNDNMDAEIFISGLIVGACCVLGNIACAVLCARGGALGVRRAAAACAGACALACACLAATACSCSNSSSVAVAAAAALNAASLNGNVLLIRLLLHALPAKLSALGVCWGAWWGRSGGVVSNLAVGVLLDYSCPAPFISVAVLLAISVGGILIIKLEDTKEDTVKTEEVDQENGTEKNVGLDKYISTYM